MSSWTPRTRNYWRLCAVVKREEPICWLCGMWIDPHLKYLDGAPTRTMHPMSFSCDHVKAVSEYPELAEERSNLRAAHFSCNQKRQKGIPRVKEVKVVDSLRVDRF